jgi:hypothetical protein
MAGTGLDSPVSLQDGERMSQSRPQAGVSRRAWHKIKRLSRHGLCRLLIGAGISARTLVKHDLLFREHYAFGLFLASIQARNLGVKELTVVELGVAGGAGLLNLCDLANVFKRDLGIAYHVVGFDMGTGLPAPVDYRDHPEIWREHQFPQNKEVLLRALPAYARVLYGRVEMTVPAFLSTVTSKAPIGFVALDLDYYSSSKAALDTLFTGSANQYLPAVPMYVDDVDVLLTYNNHCGEALAIHEFNREHAMRQIERKPVRIGRKPKYWHRHIYCLHVLDHPERNNVGQNKLGDENEINVLTI